MLILQKKKTSSTCENLFVKICPLYQSYWYNLPAYGICIYKQVHINVHVIPFSENNIGIYMISIAILYTALNSPSLIFAL